MTYCLASGRDMLISFKLLESSNAFSFYLMGLRGLVEDPSIPTV